jgi:AmmeMemoRadiSam system protein B
MPSPVEEHPGLLIRDPFQYSDTTLIIPPALVSCLEFFDGDRSLLDLRAHFVRITGDVRSGEMADQLVDTLTKAAFLQDDVFAERKAEAERRFADAEVRSAAHAGSGYPDQPEALRETLQGYLDGEEIGAEPSLAGIAAPHVSPFGGWESYRDAYRRLSPELSDRTFIILGTSHYGAPDSIGLTRKPFVTPFGTAQTDVSLVDRIAAGAGDAALLEDYCHANEHSIEFQIVFLQHMYGPGIRIVPILVGPYARSLHRGGLPENHEPVRRLLGVLGEMAARKAGSLLWVLGVDMAHMGRRYGDALAAHADQEEMLGVGARDRARIERVEQGDAQGFWELVQENKDDLKWCGSAPIYTFLRAVPEARGKLQRYQQWNIDDESVVSFGALTFTRQ